VLRREAGPNREEITGLWRGLDAEEIHNFLSSHKNNGLIDSGRV
jgi:hypothetical protein